MLYTDEKTVKSDNVDIDITYLLKSIHDFFFKGDNPLVPNESNAIKNHVITLQPTVFFIGKPSEDTTNALLPEELFINHPKIWTRFNGFINGTKPEKGYRTFLFYKLTANPSFLEKIEKKVHRIYSPYIDTEKAKQVKSYFPCFLIEHVGYEESDAIFKELSEYAQKSIYKTVSVMTVCCLLGNKARFEEFWGKYRKYYKNHNTEDIKSNVGYTNNNEDILEFLKDLSNKVTSIDKFIKDSKQGPIEKLNDFRNAFAEIKEDYECKDDFSILTPHSMPNRKQSLYRQLDSDDLKDQNLLYNLASMIYKSDPLWENLMSHQEACRIMPLIFCEHDSLYNIQNIHAAFNPDTGSLDGVILFHESGEIYYPDKLKKWMQIYNLPTDCIEEVYSQKYPYERPGSLNIFHFYADQCDANSFLDDFMTQNDAFRYNFWGTKKQPKTVGTFLQYGFHISDSFQETEDEHLLLTYLKSKNTTLKTNHENEHPVIIPSVLEILPLYLDRTYLKLIAPYESFISSTHCHTEKLSKFIEENFEVMELINTQNRTFYDDDYIALKGEWKLYDITHNNKNLNDLKENVFELFSGTQEETVFYFQSVDSKFKITASGNKLYSLPPRHLSQIVYSDRIFKLLVFGRVMYSNHEVYIKPIAMLHV